LDRRAEGNTGTLGSQLLSSFSTFLFFSSFQQCSGFPSSLPQVRKHGVFFFSCFPCPQRSSPPLCCLQLPNVPLQSMSQVPAPFRSASIPLTLIQWTSLHHLLHTQISLYPHVRKGPDPSSYHSTCVADPWNVWLETLISSDEVRQLLLNTPVATIWASSDGRARYLVENRNAESRADS